MFSLKGYQTRAIQTLSDFLTEAKSTGDVATAYARAIEVQGMPELAYRDYGFEQVPYVCFRIPTGGGKTVLASHAVATTARDYLEEDFPIALWLVPSTTIRQQTVDALKTPGHPYREKLDQAFNQQVLVLDIDEVTQIRPQDIGGKAIVVVSTLANLRVNDTAGRKVYAYHENFEPHFAKLGDEHAARARLEKVGESDLKENGLTQQALGTVKCSFANLLAVHRPVVIVDEAHNARTSLTFETLKRVHPAAVIEFTATPNTSTTNGSNVLYHVSAAELKAEEMIKLPIMLTEHTDWQAAVRDATLNRERLAKDALNEPNDYIRPIVLLQAEPKNGTVTVDVLKSYLENDLKIDPEKIAIATGAQRELDGINLFSPECKIEYIITIEALKEGWDCSFAYVFCSVKQVSSSKDAEQLLGRVLRMPYARRRVIEDLNRAYAHLATSVFSRVASQLTDKLIDMGFAEMEIADFLRHQPVTPGQGNLFGSDDSAADNPPPPPPVDPSVVLELDAMPDLKQVDEADKRQVSATREGDKVLVKVTGEVSESLAKALISATTKPKERAVLKRDLGIHNQRILAMKSPAELGERFGPLPQLCAHIQGELELVEPEMLLDAGQWSLMDYYRAEHLSLKIDEQNNRFAIDVEGKKVHYTTAEPSATYDLNKAFINVTDQDLIRWLDRELRQPDIMQLQMMKFLSRVVSDLQREVGITALVRNKFRLVRMLRALIDSYRNSARKQGYQETLFSEGAEVSTTADFQYEFSPAHYPARPPYYQGKYRFQKHYYPQIEDMKSTGEEFECAKAIDSLPQVKYWIRNLVRRDHASFWLPLADGRFYPDFVVELTDGRMLVVEYKGDAYVTNDDSVEKRAVGQLWAESSGGRCLFIMAVLQDKQGRDVRHQIQALIE
jgi:type III restriction enzyme